MPGRAQNPNNYPLTRLSQLAIAYRTDEMRLRAQLEEELQRELLRMRIEFETELIKARTAGVGVSELARQTRFSRPYMYEVLKAAGKAAWFKPDEAVVLPHSDIFTKTGDLYNEVTMRIPRTLKGLGIEAGTKIVCYAGYHPQQGWIFDPEKTAPNRTLLVPLIGPRGTIHDPQLRVEFEEWADAYWPEMKDRPDYRDTMEAREGRLGKTSQDTGTEELGMFNDEDLQ